MTNQDTTNSLSNEVYLILAWMWDRVLMNDTTATATATSIQKNSVTSFSNVGAYGVRSMSCGPCTPEADLAVGGRSHIIAASILPMIYSQSMSPSILTLSW